MYRRALRGVGFSTSSASRSLLSCTQTPSAFCRYGPVSANSTEMLTRLVEGADEQVHRIYPQLSADDERPWRDLVPEPQVAQIGR